MALKTDYKDWVAPVDGRRYRLMTNLDASVSITDVTEYLQEGDSITAEVLNGITKSTQIFTATLLASGWAYDDNTSAYTQTVTCTGMLASYDTEPPFVRVTGVKSTDETLAETLGILCTAGNYGQTLAGQIKWTLYGDAPPCHRRPANRFFFERLGGFFAFARKRTVFIRRLQPHGSQCTRRWIF